MSILERDGILRALRNAEVFLGCLDVEEVMKLLGRLGNQITLSEIDGRIGPSVWKCISEQFGIYRKFGIVPERRVSSKMPIEEAILLIATFLVSTTLKDCSILIAARQVDSSLETEVQPCVVEIPHANGKQHWMYDVKLIDLDPKPARRFPHYSEMDHKILSACEAAAVGRICFL